MCPCEYNCSSLIRCSRDHNSLVSPDALHLLVEDLNQLALDRILVKFCLYEHKK